MENEIFNETKKSWSVIGSNKPLKDLNLELSFYRKMLNVFQVGDSYSFIFHPSKSHVEYVSDNIYKVIGCPPNNFTSDFFLSRIHPDDINTFIMFEREVVDFKMKLPLDKLMKYKSQYFYRLKKDDGNYITILQQSVTIQCDDEGAILRNLVVHTDISFLKPSLANRSLSFIGIDGEPSYYNAKTVREPIHPKPLLTKRELEILSLLAKNKTTVDIATSLYISPETVSTHRKNIHKKTKTKNVFELVMKALDNGWINTLLLLLSNKMFLEFTIDSITTI